MTFTLAELTFVLLNIIAPVIAVAALGFVLARVFGLESRTPSRLSLYLFSPALVFTSIYHSKLGTEFVSIIAFAVIIFALMGVFTFILTQALRFDRLTSAAFALSTLFVNAGNLGLPLNLFAFGQEGLNRAVIYFVATSVLAQTAAIFIAARGTVTNRDALARVFKMPLIYAASLALLFNLNQWQMPEPIMKSIELISGGTVPLIITVLGIELAHAVLNQDLKAVALATVVRLIVAPAIAFGLAAVMGMEGLTRSVSVLESSMPTAVLVSIIAVEFNVKPEFVTSAVFVSTIASVATLTVLLGILR